MAATQGPVIAGVAISFAILSFVTICLRLFARIYVLKRMGLDDCKSILFRPSLAAVRLVTDLLFLLDLIIGACVRGPFPVRCD